MTNIVTNRVVKNLSIILITLMIIPLYQVGNSKYIDLAHAEDNNWYVGEGVKQGLWVKYQVKHFDTNDGREFFITIFFKEQDQNGNWIAPVYIEDQGKVYNGTFILSSLDLTALGTSEITKEMSPYRSAYTNSLKWLAAYVPKPGLSLSAGSWGKIGSIGGSEIKPSGNVQLQVPAFPNPIQTTLISYHKSVDSKIWILNEFPYPVAAQTYVDVTTGEPPIQFQFILLETGTGDPPIPLSSIQDVKPPLTMRTERGSYFIELGWSPEKITTGNKTTFTINFLDNTKFPEINVGYSLKITDSNSTILDLPNQFAKEGIGTHDVTFSTSGPIRVEVIVNSVSGVDTGVFVEKVNYDLYVN